MLKVNIKMETGKLGDPNYYKDLVGGALVRATERICEEVEEDAKDSYAQQKKSTPLLPSRIIDSFHYTTEDFNGTSVHGVVFAGGPDAPYAIYVNYPRKGFEGYYFMEDGALKGALVARGIVAEEIAKVI
jgi:hypothetical protein